MARVSEKIEFIKDISGKEYIKANSIVCDNNQSLEDRVALGTPWKVNKHQSSKTVSIDVSKIKGSDAWAFLVVVRQWVADTNSSSIFLAQGIEINQYQNVLTILNSGLNCSCSLSDNTLTITFFNNDGGGYSIIPLLK